MAREWRCAVAGVGVIGQWHARILHAMPQVTLVAGCDRQPTRAMEALRGHSVPIPVYETIEELLERESIDVLHVCTPSGDHLEPSVAAMRRGVSVICEKPIEITLERIDAMIAAAKEHHVRLAGIFQNRWSPANRIIHEAAVKGRFGNIAWAGSFNPWFREPSYYKSAKWRGTWKLDGGGAMMNQSIHSVDLLQWIAGPVKEVSAFSDCRLHQGIEVEDTLSCSLRFESGALGSIMGSTAMYPGSPARIEIGGEHGTAVSQDGLRVFSFRDQSVGDAEIQNRINRAQAELGGAGSQHLSSMQTHQANLEAIFAAWEQGHDPETSGVESRKAVAIILAMYESARAGENRSSYPPLTGRLSYLTIRRAIVATV